MTKIDCQKCDGTGEVELSTTLERTLRALKKHKNGITPTKLSAQLDMNPSACCWNLAQLEHYGLAKSVKDGRERIFKSKG